MKQKLALLMVVSFVCAFLGPGEASAQNWDLKLSHVLSPTSDYQIMANHFAELLVKKTGGKVKVTAYPSGQLGNERVAFEQLQMGALDMAISGTPVLSAWVPEGQVFDLPYLVQTRDQGLALLNGKTGDWWRELLRQRTGVRSLGFLDYGFRQVYNKTRPINTPDDLKGLKLRVLENPSYMRPTRLWASKRPPWPTVKSIRPCSRASSMAERPTPRVTSTTRWWKWPSSSATPVRPTTLSPSSSTMPFITASPLTFARRLMSPRRNRWPSRRKWRGRWTRMRPLK